MRNEAGVGISHTWHLTPHTSLALGATIFVRPPILPLIIFYAAYFLTGGLGQGLAIIPGVSITFWPPVGVLIATLLLHPLATWPWWIAAGGLAELTCNALWFHNPILAALVYYAANGLEALCAAWLIRRWTPEPFRLESTEEVTAFVVAGAGVAPMVSATIIAATDAFLGKHSFTIAWPLVWLGDSSGLLVSTPLTFVILQSWRERSRIPIQRIIEAVLLGVVLVVGGTLVLRNSALTAYLLLPPLLWAAVRFQLKGAAAALGLVTILASLFTVAGKGEFAGNTESQRGKIMMLQTFLGVSAVSTLMVAALSQQHQQTLQHLMALNSQLETRVAERTANLQVRIRQLDLLASTSQRLIMGELPTNELLASVFAEIGQLVGMEMFFHYIYSSQPPGLELVTYGGISEEERRMFSTIKTGERLGDRVAQQDAPLIIDDLFNSSQSGIELLVSSGAKSYAGFPLLARGELLGTLEFVSRKHKQFREGEIQMIQTLCDQIAAVLERARLLDEVQESEERLRLIVQRLAELNASLEQTVAQRTRELRELQRQVLEIASDEQRRIGQELHDSTQQELTGLSLISRTLESMLDELPKPLDESQMAVSQLGLQRLREMAHRMTSGLVKTNRHVRQLSHGIMPVQIDGQGLKSALSELAAETSVEQELRCTFHCSGEVNVRDNSTATHLYRIAQEALNNALRHSQADEISIELTGSSEQVVLEIGDNGIGMEAASKRQLVSLNEGQGFGLRIMDYRAQIIGADLQVLPREGGRTGTIVRCRLVQEKENANAISV